MRHRKIGEQANGASTAPRTDTRTPLEKLIDMQAFDGHWAASQELRTNLDPDYDVIIVVVDRIMTEMKWDRSKEKENVVATALVIGHLETVLKDEVDTWELLAEKGREWLKAALGEEVADELFEKVMKVVAEMTRSENL